MPSHNQGRTPWTPAVYPGPVAPRGVRTRTGESGAKTSAMHGESGYERVANDAYWTPAWCTESIITNPPYKLAEAFIRKALELTEPLQGRVAMLLRNEYDCAKSRRDLFEHPAFLKKIVLTKRPRWSTEDKASPRHNFAWYIWCWKKPPDAPPVMEWGP